MSYSEIMKYPVVKINGKVTNGFIKRCRSNLSSNSILLKRVLKKINGTAMYATTNSSEIEE